jgi:hypothetical protein
MIKRFPKKRTPSTVLSLALDGNRLESSVVRRSNGSLKVLQKTSGTLALNPLNSDPELMGREFRNNLEQAGIKERNCVVCIPLSWALVVQVKVPAMPEADIASFLEIEAERGFPYAPETLVIATSVCSGDKGERLATLVAVPRNHVLQLEKALRAAQLKPLSFTFGIAALHSTEEDTNRGALCIDVGENSVGLQITLNNGVAILRSLDSVIEVEGSQRRIDADAMAREIRVTLGQLPMEMRGAIRNAFLFGHSELAQRFVSEIRPKLEAMRMLVESVTTYTSNAFRSQFPANTTVSSELSVAARLLTGVMTPFEFLPPKVSAWQQITSRVSSRKLGSLAAAAAVIFLVVGGAIGAQQWKFSKLRSQWAGMERPVAELEETQKKIRRFRPWFDESLPSLSILRRVTEAFPVEGAVWTKTLEIRAQSQVICSGTTRNSPAFTKMLDQLRAAPEVSNVSVDSVRGNSPAMQFTFNFQWNSGGRSEN